MDLESIGRTIRRIRQARGMTQDGLANAARLSRNYLSQIERGMAGNFSLETLFRIAEGLRVSPVEIIGGEGAQTETVISPSLNSFALKAKLNYAQVEFLARLPFADNRRPRTVAEWEAIYTALKPYIE